MEVDINDKKVITLVPESEPEKSNQCLRLVIDNAGKLTIRLEETSCLTFNGKEAKELTDILFSYYKDYTI